MRFYQLDNDTKKYIKRLNYNGIKTPSDITSVDQFIRGLKDSGLWANCLDIWFLRSEQNSGSGNIVYPFRNDSSKITLINSPTWTSNGIYFNGSNQYGSLNNLQTGSAISDISFATCFLCHDISSTRRAILSSESSGTSRGPFIAGNSSPKAGATAGALYSEFTFDGSISPNSVIGIGSAITRNFQTTITSFSRNKHDFVINGGSVNTNTDIATAWNNNSIFYVGTRNASEGFLLGTISFLIWWNFSINTSSMQNFHSLIKSTIGKGLALP
jgi:hypothetical protein